MEDWFFLPPIFFIDGFAIDGSHDHSLRNHIVGNRVSDASSGPRFATVISIRMSSDVDFAYSMRTSKYRLSAKTPESMSSNSGSSFVRRPFSVTSCAYGYSACGYLY